jgi:hypothetical protein
MDKINELFECQIGDAINAFPSVFSKDDVVDILSKLRTNVLYAANEIKSTTGITEEQFQEFNANVRHRLDSSMCNGSIDLYDYSSAEFSIDYHNTIVIENIDFNSDSVTEELDEIMLDEFQKSFGDLIIKTEE